MDLRTLDGMDLLLELCPKRDSTDKTLVKFESLLLTFDVHSFFMATMGNWTLMHTLTAVMVPQSPIPDHRQVATIKQLIIWKSSMCSIEEESSSLGGAQR